MTTTLQQINHHNPVADNRIFGAMVLLTLPALLFSNLMPPWAPPVATLGLLFIVLLRCLALGRLSQTPVDAPLLGLLLLLPVGLWVSADPTITLPRTYALIANIALFWVIAAQWDDPWLRYSGWVLLFGGLILSIALFFGTNFLWHKLPVFNRDFYDSLPVGWRPFWNAEGFNPNMTGGLIAMFLAPAFVLIWGGYNWQQRDIAKPIVIVLALLLILTQSRGALLGMGLALLVITLLHNRRWSVFWGLMLIGLLVATYQYGFGSLLENILGRSDLFGDRSFLGRQQLWQRAIFIIRDFPLTGVGLGMFEPTVRHLYPSETLINITEEFKHAHNLYLQAAVEMGLIGLVAYGIIFFTLLRLLWARATDLTAGYYRTLAIGLLGSLIVFLTHGFFEVITYAPRAAIIVWALFGLMVAVTTRPVSARSRSSTAPAGHQAQADAQPLGPRPSSHEAVQPAPSADQAG